MFNHILLEVFCSKEYDENLCKEEPNFCQSNDHIPQYECLANNCPYATFTSHENALCFINDKSEAGKIISLGGEMIPKNQRDEDVKDLWQKIAIDKMNEAYQVYMEKLKNNTESDSACAMVKESLK